MKAVSLSCMLPTLKELGKETTSSSYQFIFVCVCVLACVFQVQEGRREGAAAGSHADLPAQDPAAHRPADGRRHHLLCPHPETDPQDLSRSRTGVCACLCVCVVFDLVETF